MALISLNLKPSDKQLRSFALIAMLMCSIIGLLLVWTAGLPLTGFLVFCIVGVAIFVMSRISLKLVRPIYMGLIIITFPIGWIVSHIMMGLFYYVVIGGVGFVFKLLKRDPLHRAFDPQAESYWVAYKHKRTPKDYFRQF
jgi:hypothetical protein